VEQNRAKANGFVYGKIISIDQVESILVNGNLMSVEVDGVKKIICIIICIHY
jgi:hypothetical protein